MKLMSMKQYSKMTKASLVRKIMKALKKLPKMKLAKLCYELEKKRLPSISTTKKGMPRLTARRAYSHVKKTPYSLRQRAINREFYTKTGRRKKYRLLRKGKKREKLKTGIHFVIVGDKKRKVKVLKNGQWRFMKQ
tara:strand:- start:43 stop:447 length:405 start_codon:yes stop_codon:yes gene_type:complete